MKLMIATSTSNNHQYLARTNLMVSAFQQFLYWFFIRVGDEAETSPFISFCVHGKFYILNLKATLKTIKVYSLNPKFLTHPVIGPPIFKTNLLFFLFLCLEGIVNFM